MCTLLTYNIKGGEQQCLSEIGQFISDLSPDIICLQEVCQTSTLDQFQYLTDMLDYPYSHFLPVFDRSQDYGKGVLQAQPLIE